MWRLPSTTLDTLGGIGARLGVRWGEVRPMGEVGDFTAAILEVYVVFG